MIQKKTYYFFFVIALAFVSCNKNQKDIELTLLSDYLEEHNITQDPLPDGLYFINTGFSTSETINSEVPHRGDTVIISYKGYLLADPSVVFDEKTIKNPAYYVYLTDNVIPGWEEAVGMMKKDAPVQIIIPSDLAYNGKQTGIIPPYSTLIFEARILDIKKP